MCKDGRQHKEETHPDGSRDVPQSPSSEWCTQGGGDQWRGVSLPRSLQSLQMEVNITEGQGAFWTLGGAFCHGPLRNKKYVCASRMDTNGWLGWVHNNYIFWSLRIYGKRFCGSYKWEFLLMEQFHHITALVLIPVLLWTLHLNCASRLLAKRTILCVMWPPME